MTIPLAGFHELAARAGVSAADRLDALRSAGYAGGAQLAAEFDVESRARFAVGADELPLERYTGLLREFFLRAGWGEVSLTSLQDSVAAIDVRGCWERRAGVPHGRASCHFTTAALTAFFERNADYPVGALEVECGGGDDGDRCRFLLGPTSVLDRIYDALAAGSGYESALS